MNNNAIVQKLWSLCDILRDDGITYHQYVTEPTLLLFLKMAQETQGRASPAQGLPLVGPEGAHRAEASAATSAAT